jgi:hypothetical protein
MTRPVCGDTVKWSNGKKPLGVVVHAFYHDGKRFVVIEGRNKVLKVALDCDALRVVAAPVISQNKPVEK